VNRPRRKKQKESRAIKNAAGKRIIAAGESKRPTGKPINLAGQKIRQQEHSKTKQQCR